MNTTQLQERAALAPTLYESLNDITDELAQFFGLDRKHARMLLNVSLASNVIRAEILDQATALLTSNPDGPA